MSISTSPRTATHDGHSAGVEPQNSLRTFAGLMQLVRMADTDRESRNENATIDGLISRNVLRRLLTALHFRDLSCVRHCRRVALLAVSLAEQLGWEGRQLKALEIASLLHDVGKIGVPDNVLFKPAKLSPDELELMAMHYNIGLDVLQACRVDREILEIVTNSHAAHLAGDGFPKVGQESHLGGRILAVADAYEALSTEQAYRPARTHDEILQVLIDASGKQFDGNVVNALGRMARQEGLPFALQLRELEDSLKHRGPLTAEEADDANSLALLFSQLYMLESLYDGFSLVDADLRMVCWNKGAENLLGRSSAEMLGRTWTSKLLDYRDTKGQTLNEQQCPMHLVLQHHTTIAEEVQIPRADGRCLRIELQTIPQFDEHGQLQGVIEIFRDLTRSGGRRPQEFRELKLAATRDALTAVANRGELETQLTQLVTTFARNPLEPFSVIFADADHFKSINDTYGHTVGDEVLIEIARTLQQETYSGELVGRYGGEEFVVLCPGTDLEQSVRRAERLRNGIRAMRIAGHEKLKVTASFGVAQVEPGDSVESVLRRADKALYSAKSSGRDRTCSLTNNQLLKSDSPLGTGSESQNVFLYTTWFAAVVASELVVYKLGGYVNDHEARLTEVTSEHVVMQLGKRGLFPYWGRDPAYQPVEVQVLFGSAKAAEDAVRGRAQPRMNVGIRVRPLGWCNNPQVFQQRAAAVVRELRHYFVGD